MPKYSFRPRKTFNNDLNYLGKIDPSIIDDIREPIEILLNGDELPEEYNDHNLKRKYAGYREFHVRDTPKGGTPSETNDVLVIYKKDVQDLILVAVRTGSHSKLFNNSYRKNR
ncbi:type II toxin-antitoxin system YafQ family toxin [Limosilactobacillus agrestimuris]|uniref:type II toxin-antitoxin system YafQ family toxin n=1 Tax=Limosilactobacillus agrestimuris TaxID=2941331 RepID=UPI00203E3887|nr:type II toxin-antitoxin system YafQ family toxin [Limosilactobacillus agrestimuris]